MFAVPVLKREIILMSCHFEIVPYGPPIQKQLPTSSPEWQLYNETQFCWLTDFKSGQHFARNDCRNHEYTGNVYNILRGAVQAWPPYNYVFEARDGAIMPAIVAAHNINLDQTGFIWRSKNRAPREGWNTLFKLHIT
jgi:hypothetical protein